mgnify:CR=1 FL=1
MLNYQGRGRGLLNLEKVYAKRTRCSNLIPFAATGDPLQAVKVIVAEHSIVGHDQCVITNVKHNLTGARMPAASFTSSAFWMSS